MTDKTFIDLTKDIPDDCIPNQGQKTFYNCLREADIMLMEAHEMAAYACDMVEQILELDYWRNKDERNTRRRD